MRFISTTTVIWCSTIRSPHCILEAAITLFRLTIFKRSSMEAMACGTTFNAMKDYDIIESLIRSVYRYMAKMATLTIVEEEIFKFLRNSFHVHPQKLKPEL